MSKGIVTVQAIQQDEITQVQFLFETAPNMLFFLQNKLLMDVFLPSSDMIPSGQFLAFHGSCLPGSVFLMVALIGKILSFRFFFR